MKKAFSLYVLTSVLSSGLGFLVTIFLTKLIPPEEFAYIGLYGSIIFFLAPLLSFQTSGLVALNIVQLDKTKYAEFMTRYFSFVLCVSAICLIIAIVISTFLPNFRWFIFVTFLTSLFTMLTAVHYSELVQSRLPSLHSFYKLFSVALGTIVSIVLVKTFSMSWLGRLLGILIGLATTFLIMKKESFRSISIKFQYDAQTFREIFSYGLPLMIGLGAAWIVTQLDKYVILHFFGMKELGYYSLGYTLGTSFQIINQSMVNALVPKLFEALRSGTARLLIKKISLYYSIVLAVLLLLFSIAISYLGPAMFGENYRASIPIIRLLLVASAFDGFYRIHGLVIAYFRENALSTKIAYFIALCNFVFAVGLVPVLGLMAPAIGTILSYLLNFVLNFYFSKKILAKNSIS